MARHFSGENVRKGNYSCCLFKGNSGVGGVAAVLPTLRTVLVMVVGMVVFVGSVSEGKVCSSIEVKNEPEKFETLRNCTVIMGYLKIVLFNMEESFYGQYTFPELTEISDYVLLYRVLNLRNLSHMFPNLRVIRGRTLLLGSSVIIFRMPQMTEIGLHNLVHIGRGSVRIDYCPNLCYVNTINWEAMGATSLEYYNMNKNKCGVCPKHCGGECWDEHHCQKRESKNCHSECIGCTKENSSSDCLHCRHYSSAGTCVNNCPPGKVLHQYTLECISPAECPTMLNGTWWVFHGLCLDKCPPAYFQPDLRKGSCEYCGDSCIKICNGTVIDRLDVLEGFRGCTRVNGSLDLRINETYTANHLETNLGDLREITGYLKVGRSSAIRSLNFLKNLKLIRGKELDNKRYALFVYDNRNLQQLWDFTGPFSLKIERGTMAFHDNPLLCMSEIQQIFNRTGTFLDEDDRVMFQHSNGDKASCSVKDLKIEIVENNPTNITISWKKAVFADNATIIGYAVYYTEDTGKDLTAFASKEVCGNQIWFSVFSLNTTQQLVNLTPYTTYGYYIKIYSTSLRGEQTPIHKFTTKPDDPSEPVDFQALAWTDDSIKLKWGPPESINGNFTHYHLLAFYEADHLPLIEQRDYCLNPHEAGSDEVLETPVEVWPSNDTSSNCSCVEEESMKMFDISSLCQSNKYSPVNPSCTKFSYQLYDKTHEENIKFALFENDEFQISKRESENTLNFSYFFRNETISPDDTSYVVDELLHFSMYIFFLRACNEKEGDKEHCSAPVMAFNRTRKKLEADDVLHIDVEIKGNDAFIKWSEPIESNSLVVAYQVEHRRTDLEHSKPTTKCITRREFVNSSRTHHIKKLLYGKYLVRVQATSLAGPGKFSQPIYFEIVAPYTGLGIGTSIVIVTGVLFMLCLGILISYQFYKKRRSVDNIHLITNVNPDYAGPVYVVDEWEVDRNDVEILKELGRGTFGMVYQGLLKSTQYPCAVKTVGEQASMQERMQFLNEGSVMKSFNDGHHVVKLVGVVSKGQPPYVIMELMERGDLKSFLRHCRGSQNLTTNEIYRMAAEIADGMAYLTAKKFVHRDLAARNCMVAADRTVKIGDFGMARDIYETDYYRKDTVGLLPVRWMAPESLADGVFTSDSDVWSFGIVLWEMATLAEQPYQGLSNEEVLNFVKARGRLERPSQCSDLMYEMMSACWRWRPNDRPTFVEIVDKLVSHVGEDFRLVAFCYSRQGREHALNAGPRVYNPPALSAVVPEDDFFGHYDANEDEVELFMGEENRPNRFFPFASQRFSKSPPRQISPGSPTSTYSLNSS